MCVCVCVYYELTNIPRCLYIMRLCRIMLEYDNNNFRSEGHVYNNEFFLLNHLFFPQYTLLLKVSGAVLKLSSVLCAVLKIK